MVRQTITAIAIGLMVTAQVWAGENRADEVAALTKAKDKLAQAGQGAGKPGQIARARRQREEVQNLLDQLQEGRNVDPADVDRVLRQANQPLY